MKKAKKEGTLYNPEKIKEIDAASKEDLASELRTAQLSSAAIAAILGQDAALASHIGGVAGTHNWEPSISGVIVKVQESYQEAQQFAENHVEEAIETLEKTRKKPYTDEEKEQVRDNLRKLYIRSYLDYKASGVLVEGIKLHLATGAIITSAEIAYGYATGDMDAYEATTSMVGATTAAAGRAGKLFNLGTKAHDATVKKETPIKAAEYEDLVGLKGEYRFVKGHHVHAKKAFDGHVNYDPQKGFSISEEYMKSIGVKHQNVTLAQRKHFIELAKSGRPNTIYEHSRIAVESLVDAGASRGIARKVVAESLIDLRRMGVKNPINIPWNSK